MPHTPPHSCTKQQKTNIQTEAQHEIIQINVYACAPAADDKLEKQKQTERESNEL